MSAPNIDHLLRADLLATMRKQYPSMAAAERERRADILLAEAASAGTAMRRERLARDVARLRADVAARARRGAYPRRRWRELRAAEQLVRAEAR